MISNGPSIDAPQRSYHNYGPTAYGQQFSPLLSTPQHHPLFSGGFERPQRTEMERPSTVQPQPLSWDRPPNERTPLLTSTSSIVVRRVPPRSSQKGRMCDEKGVVLIFLIFVSISYFVYRTQDYSYPAKGLLPYLEADTAIQCLPVEASVPLYPRDGWSHIMKAITSIDIEVIGIGIGTIRIAVHALISNPVYSNHFHLTPGLSDLPFSTVTTIRDNKVSIKVQTPPCLRDPCRGNSSAIQRDNGCVIVGSILLLPPRLSDLSLSKIRVSAEATSIDMSFSNDDDIHLDRVELFSNTGSIRVVGLSANTLSLNSTKGSLKMFYVGAGSASLFTKAGSISLENVAAGTLATSAEAGTVRSKNVVVGSRE
ncbi:hypothetical protein DFJ73DRAFT_375708 [Zopfochytrium polystomum]|nr:hypothetical protein DFJ73DRAFT_375708 [Zopfochytrium polystomum]